MKTKPSAVALAALALTATVATAAEEPKLVTPPGPVWVRGDRWMECVPIGWGSTQGLDARGAAYEDALSGLAAILQQPQHFQVDPVNFRGHGRIFRILTANPKVFAQSMVEITRV